MPLNPVREPTRAQTVSRAVGRHAELVVFTTGLAVGALLALVGAVVALVLR